MFKKQTLFLEWILRSKKMSIGARGKGPGKNVYKGQGEGLYNFF